METVDAPVEEVSCEILIINELGMHARPAAAMVQTALRFESEVYVEARGRRVNAKSIMGLLTLAAGHGTSLTIYCKGPDAREALEALRALIESSFGEA